MVICLYREVFHAYEQLGFPDFSGAITTYNFEQLAETVDAFEIAFETFCVKYHLEIPRISTDKEIKDLISTKK